MDIKLSRRIAIVVNSPFFIKMNEKAKNSFINRVKDFENYSNLLDSDKEIIIKSEKSRNEPVW